MSMCWRDTRHVLTRNAVDNLFPDDPDWERVLKLADDCEIPVHPEFVPNCGEGATMRAGHDADPSAPLLVHALRDAEAGLCVKLPLAVAVKAAKAEGIKLHVSERFLRDKDGDPLGRPIPFTPTLLRVPRRTIRT